MTVLQLTEINKDHSVLTDEFLIVCYEPDKPQKLDYVLLLTANNGTKL